MRATMFGVMLFLLPLCGAAQLNFADSSRLGDPAYVQERIREISDAELFSSLRLESPAAASVRRALQARDTAAAYAAWGRVWREGTRPVYVTETERLMLDTDILTDYESHRLSLTAHQADRESVLARVEGILQNRIRVWGDRVESFGAHVDFNRDVGRSGRYGFHYWMWSRPLLSAAVLTGELQSITKFRELFHRWYHQRNTITRSIPELDVVYYELGIGARTKVFLEYYLYPEPGRPWQTDREMLKTLLGAGRWLYELERWEGYRPGNWQIVGAYALVQLALTVREFRESDEWLETGLQRLMEHLERDFFADGGHSERCPRNYTALTYLSYRNLLYLLEHHKVRPDIAAKVRSAIARTVDWWVAMMTPLGETPAINDSHRGHFPARIMEDAQRLFGIREGVEVVRRLAGGMPGDDADLPQYTSRHLPASGFTVMRSGWDRDALSMSINHGPSAGSHTHADLLGIELFAYGKALAVDAGIGMTYDDLLYFTWYKSTRAHNTIAINDSDMVREGRSGERIVWDAGAELEYFSGEHRGYADRNAVHRRQALFVKPSYWIVYDEVRGGLPGDTVSFYVHSPLTLKPSGNGFVTAEVPGVVVLPPAPMLSKTGWGTAATVDDPHPGRTSLINWIRFDSPADPEGVQRFPVLLYPFRARPDGVGFVEESPGLFRVSRGDTVDYVAFGPTNEGRLRTGAACAWVRLAGGKVIGSAATGGEDAVFDGRRLSRGTIR